jgi:hypothetical protein
MAHINRMLAGVQPDYLVGAAAPAYAVVWAHADLSAVQPPACCSGCVPKLPAAEGHARPRPSQVCAASGT